MRRSFRRLPDETPEGRSIVVLAKEQYGLRGRELAQLECGVHSVQRADADVGRGHGGAQHSQGRGGCDCAII